MLKSTLSNHDKTTSLNRLDYFLKIALEIKAAKKWNRICLILRKPERKAGTLWLLIAPSQPAPLNNVRLTDG